MRVLHASPDAPNVDVYADGEEVLSDVAFGAISDYLEAPAGEYRIQVFAASPEPALGRTAPIVTASEAINNAEAAAGGGNVAGLELERELRRTIWQADVAGTSRRAVEVWVDAETGGLLGPASSSAVSCNRFGCKADVDAQVGNTSVNCNRFGCNARR